MINKMGRPKAYVTEEIKNIIDSYLAYTGGTILLNASKIAKYVNDELELPNFKYYVINRDPEAKKYLEGLNARITGVSDKKISFTKSVFTQIDINSYLSMKKDDLKVALYNLNVLLEDMSNANTELIKENLKLKTRVQEKDTEIRRVNKEVIEKYTDYQKGMDASKEMLVEQKQKIQELTIKMKQQDDLTHILWDREAENILKKNGVFVDNGVELTEDRVISDIDADIIEVVKDTFPNIEDDKISYELINRIKSI
ncbi:hypothetical protein [Paenibacillus antarcticus]|uniref:Uncharacterized protein n=1 Tax=Paenibacillus antarcticus TaxID=253703 RepID=A0A168KAR5_9BACL|nr:hypothetical protein [Paenibacillus antarcticus]OAB41780.1 hypothetical protein PBAT_20560 [Paenibacillus antarcticus]